MLKILLFAFFFIFFIIVVLGSVLRGVVGFFMPKGQNKKHDPNNGYGNNKENLSPNDTQKQFSDDVGEYVSYEEIKEKEE